MMKWMVHLALVATILAGCGKAPSHVENGRSYAQANNPDDARREFILAVLENPEDAEAHIALARMSERAPEEILLAAWHYRMALKSPALSAGARQMVQEALTRCEDTLSEELESSAFLQEKKSLLFKIGLLEEHARKQTAWLETLRNENTRFRKRLDEVEK